MDTDQAGRTGLGASHRGHESLAGKSALAGRRRFCTASAWRCGRPFGQPPPIECAHIVDPGKTARGQDDLVGPLLEFDQPPLASGVAQRPDGVGGRDPVLHRGRSGPLPGQCLGQAGPPPGGRTQQRVGSVHHHIAAGAICGGAARTDAAFHWAADGEISSGAGTGGVGDARRRRAGSARYWRRTGWRGSAATRERAEPWAQGHLARQDDG